MDALLKEAIEDTFNEFDEDKSGHLDKEETYKLLLMPICKLNGGEDLKDAKKMFGNVMNEDDFDKFFNHVDSDGSGGITREELVEFIKLCAKV